MAKEDVSIPRISLDPAKAEESLAILCQSSSNAAVASHGDIADATKKREILGGSAECAQAVEPPLIPGSEPTAATLMPSSTASDCADQPVFVSSSVVVPATNGVSVEQPPPASTFRQPFAKPDHARFKYLEGFAYRPTDHFTNLPELNTHFPQENDPLRVSAKFVAFSCSGIGGQVGIVCCDSPGRVSAKLARIVHGADVVSMEFDPFDAAVLATAGADCKLHMWRVPDTPLNNESHFELEESIHVAADRIHQLRFHPCAKGIFAVLVSDADHQAIRVYHGLVLHCIIGKCSDGIHSFAWSPSGEQIALTTKKSKQVRVYDAHTQEQLSM
ncbi:hypothetical protein IWW38_005886, partial [Coemansia aciculifera]